VGEDLTKKVEQGAGPSTGGCRNERLLEVTSSKSKTATDSQSQVKSDDQHQHRLEIRMVVQVRRVEETETSSDGGRLRRSACLNSGSSARAPPNQEQPSPPLGRICRGACPPLAAQFVVSHLSWLHPITRARDSL
jgi:hypothetical protein